MIRGIIYPRNAANATMSNRKPKLFQLFSHSRPAVAAKRKTVLFADMCQQYHVIPLTLAHWAASPGPQPTGCYLQNATQNLDGKGLLHPVNKRKSHCF